MQLYSYGFHSIFLFSLVLACRSKASSASEWFTIAKEVLSEQDPEHNEETLHLLNDLHKARLDLWRYGEFGLHTESSAAKDLHSIDDATIKSELHQIEKKLRWARLGPIREARRHFGDEESCLDLDCNGAGLNGILRIRGGDNTDQEKGGVSIQDRIASLGLQFGSDFIAAIKKNEEEHESDCETSCQSFYCAPASSDRVDMAWNSNGTSFHSYSFGATPPEDFAEDFGFPLDLIKVTEGEPLFSSEEAAEVISLANGEGLEHNEYKSGKYQLGGDWLLNLPKTRSWFNQRLESTFFPLLHHLFPEIVSSPSVLRAHSVSLLKYNSSHPRTDVHIDNGILAMTLAMSKQDAYVGGGTFFEHMGVQNILPMDVGHGTFRPGSVRHGGHKVTEGERYILGAFLLISDRVEHVRRLKNRGSEIRKQGDLKKAAQHFEWALALNPKCTTCLKDWAEILYTEKRFGEAESKIREVLRLLEDLDSDALFTLGLILSEQNRNEESIEAYSKSIQLNSDDAELCYNLAIKLGAKGDRQGEMKYYAKAVEVDPKFGGAWLNWGSSLAESGNIDDAEVMFLKALSCKETSTKGMMNLALLYQKQASSLAAQGNILEAKNKISRAAELLDTAKPLLEKADRSDIEYERYSSQFPILRLQCHQLKGSILASMKEYDACEKEFRLAVQNFPTVPQAKEMLARILELQGRHDEAKEVRGA